MDSKEKYCRCCNLYALPDRERRSIHRYQILKQAVCSGDVEDAKSMIDTFGLSYSRGRLNDYNLLRDALRQQRPEMAKLLLTSGAKVNRKKERIEETPLHLAARFGYTEIATMLLDRNAATNVLDDFLLLPYYRAVLENSIEIVELFLERKVDEWLYMAKRPYSLSELLFENNYETTKMLLNRVGARVEAFGQDPSIKSMFTPLHVALFKDYDDLAELLINKGADINAEMDNKQTPLHIAAIRGNEKIVKLLLEKGVNIDAQLTNGDTALHAAISRRSISVAEILLANKANCNIVGQYQSTPLHCAVRKLDSTLVQMILDNGADVNAKERNGSTALHIASEMGCDSVIDILIERNANLDAEDLNKCSPLHIAVGWNNSDIVEKLLTLGAVINSKNIEGKTPLHLAAKWGSPTVVQKLLNHGADVNDTCDESMTSLEYTGINVDDDEFIWGEVTGEFKEVADILKEHIIALMALGLYVSEKNRKAIDLHYKDLNIQKDHQPEVPDMKTQQIAEVAEMKNKKIADSTVTLYDVVTANTHQLATYAKNDRIVEALETMDFSGYSQTYSSMITRRIKEARKQKNLLSSGRKCLSLFEQ